MMKSKIKPQRTYATRTGAALKVVSIRKQMVTYIRPDAPAQFQNTIPLDQFATHVEREIKPLPFPPHQVRKQRSYELRSGKIAKVIEFYMADNGEQMLIYEHRTGLKKGHEQKVRFNYFVSQVVRRVD